MSFYYFAIYYLNIYIYIYILNIHIFNYNHYTSSGKVSFMK